MQKQVSGAAVMSNSIYMHTAIIKDFHNALSSPSLVSNVITCMRSSRRCSWPPWRQHWRQHWWLQVAPLAAALEAALVAAVIAALLFLCLGSLLAAVTWRQLCLHGSAATMAVQQAI